MQETRNILVTGGAGYIGSHTCKALAGAGYRPVTVDNLVRGHEWAVRWGPFEKCDIADAVEMGRVFETYRPSAVIHFAAYAYVGESMSHPIMYYDNNVCGTSVLLETMARHRCDRMVFSSSCATYGLPQSLPITEDQAQNPISPYGRSKLFVEQMLADCDSAHGIRHINLRYFNAAGADPNGELGECHEPETHLIPLVIAAALGRDSVNIFGSDYSTADGTAVRDYIHVMDLAEAHILALEHLLSGGRSESFNLGSEQGHSVLEVVRSVERIVGKELPVVRGARRHGDPPELFASAAKARDALGWIPVLSDLETITRTAWKWHERRSCN